MDGIYVYDISELLDEVKNVETQISELVSYQSEQVSEMLSFVSETADNTSLINAQIGKFEILMFVIIAFIGMICGLLIANCIRK